MNVLQCFPMSELFRWMGNGGCLLTVASAMCSAAGGGLIIEGIFREDFWEVEEGLGLLGIGLGLLALEIRTRSKSQ